MVIQHHYYSTRQEIFFSHRNIFLALIKFTVYSTLFAVLVKAFIERPFAILVDMLIPKKKFSASIKVDNQLPLLKEDDDRRIPKKIILGCDSFT